MRAELQRGRLRLAAYAAAVALTAIVLLGMHCGRAAARDCQTVAASHETPALPADSDDDGARRLQLRAPEPRLAAGAVLRHGHDGRVALRSLPPPARPMAVRPPNRSRESDDPDRAV
jgi:hypothetical protein